MLVEFLEAGVKVFLQGGNRLLMLAQLVAVVINEPLKFAQLFRKLGKVFFLNQDGDGVVHIGYLYLHLGDLSLAKLFVELAHQVFERVHPALS